MWFNYVLKWNGLDLFQNFLYLWEILIRNRMLDAWYMIYYGSGLDLNYLPSCSRQF